MRIIINITGVLLMLTAVWCFTNSGAAFADVAFLLGVVMAAAGGASVLGFIYYKNIRRGIGWMLSEGIITLLLGIVTLADVVVTDRMTVAFYGMWVMFSGSVRLADAFTLRTDEHRGWIWTLGIAVISLVCGMYAFFNPMYFGAAVLTIIGVLFLVQGANTLLIGTILPSKHVKQVQPRMDMIEEKIEEKVEETVEAVESEFLTLFRGKQRAVNDGETADGSGIKIYSRSKKKRDEGIHTVQAEPEEQSARDSRSIEEKAEAWLKDIGNDR